MRSYGRDAIWDLDTWAEIDAAVSDEVGRVSVVHKLFGVEKVGTADEAGIAVPAAEVRNNKVLSIPDDDVAPYAELAVAFELTPAQVEAETVLHQGRALARLAAKRLALAIDQYVFRHPAARVRLLAPASIGVTDRPGVWDRAAAIGAGAPTDADLLFAAVNQAMSELLTDGWPDPFALVLSNSLYTDAYSSMRGTNDTPVKRLAGRVAHVFTSPALTGTEGVLASLAGEAISVYVARHAAATFTGETSDSQGRGQYRFRVYERLQYVIRDRNAIVRLTLR